MKRNLCFLFILSFFILFQSCEEKPKSQQKIEQAAVEKNIQRLATATDIPTLTHSLERENIKKRLEAFTDPNKVTYIYLISYGRVMAYYPVLGKITSGTKRMTTNQKMAKGYYTETVVLESPSLDGTYGSSEQYIFFWTVDGVYIQWSGEYMLSDQPLELMQQPVMIYNMSTR